MVRAAVIGVGSMGKNHARVYSELAEAELVAACDTDTLVAESIAERLGVIPYTDYRQLLEKEKPEVVSIAVPTALHEEVTLIAIQAGAHVLVEKPIAATVEEGRNLIVQARRLDRKLMVGHILRFNPAIQMLKKKVDAGDLGRIFQVVCRRIGPFPARIRDVGVVVDLAPHDLDIMRFITGLDPLRIYAETSQRIHTDHEDLVYGLLHFPNSITGALEINWLTPTKVREIVVLGERGAFRVDDLTQDLYFYENAQANGELWSSLRNLKGVSEGKMTRFPLTRHEPLKAELRAFIEAIQEEKPVPVSGSDGLIALGLALTLVKSGLNHQVIWVENGFA